MSDHETRYPDPGIASGGRVEELIDALISLAGMAFLVWLAVAWADRTFGSPAAATLFSGFFLALAAACLLRCLWCLRRLTGRER